MNYSIGLSALDAAQRALDVIGNNIANAGTEGYHRQRVEFEPAFSTMSGGTLLGGGVDIEGVTRLIDTLLEQEILRQQSLLEQATRESMTLETIENTLGEFGSGEGGLDAVMDKFFNVLNEMSASEVVWQEEIVSSAKTLASKFRTIAEFLTNLESQIRLETENTIETVNTLTSQIAALNVDIQKREISGEAANNLRDKRDQYIFELSKLVSVQTQSGEYGVVDVSVSDIPVVLGGSTVALEVGLNENAELGISVAGDSNYITNITGGEIGGLLSLKNVLISDIHTKLDLVASTVIQQINQYHIQGVGTAGSFTELTGWGMSSGDLSDYGSTVSDGNIYIRVIDSSGNITRNEISVTTSDSLTDIATSIDAIKGLSAFTLESGTKLRIQADAGYEFDFLPAVLPEPEAADINFNGTSDPAVNVSGIYTGSSNDIFTFEVSVISGDGTIGNGEITLTVTDSGLNEIATLNIGLGYSAGDTFELDNGIKVSLGPGNLADGDDFKVDAFGNTDTSGLLAAVGMNTFFSGTSASDIAVCSDISSDPTRVATAMGGDMTDYENAKRMAGIKNQTFSGLSNLTVGGYYRALVADIGLDVSVRQTNKKDLDVMVQELTNQQTEVSGVDINEEAAQLLIFEQMFQAAARYLTTIQTSFMTMLDIL